MSPADLSDLRSFIAAMWPEVARGFGAALGARMLENNGIARIYGDGGRIVGRALHSLADVLEDRGWNVRRDGDDIYVTSRVPANMSDADRLERTERILRERDARRRADMRSVGGMNAKVAHARRVNAAARRSKW